MSDSIDRSWFVDCYGADDEFPLNSYGPHSLDYALLMSRRILRRPMSGIEHVSITKTSKGCSPVIDPGEAWGLERLELTRVKF